MKKKATRLEFATEAGNLVLIISPLHDLFIPTAACLLEGIYLTANWQDKDDLSRNTVIFLPTHRSIAGRYTRERLDEKHKH